MRRCPQQGLPHARDNQHGGKRPRERIEPAPASTRWWGAGGRLAPSGAGAASPQVHTDASRGRSCGGVPYTSLSPATLSCRHYASIPSIYPVSHFCMLRVSLSFRCRVWLRENTDEDVQKGSTPRRVPCGSTLRRALDYFHRIIGRCFRFARGDQSETEALVQTHVRRS